MNTKWITMIIVAAAGLTALADVARSQDCGPPPGAWQTSYNFQKAIRKYSASSMQIDTDGSAALPIEGIPVEFKGNGDYNESDTSWSELTISEARTYIQQEMNNPNAELLRVCGYYACKMSSSFDPYANGSNLWMQVCRDVAPGADQPGHGSGFNFRPTIGDEDRPAYGTVAFDSDVPETRIHIIRNDTPFPMQLTWYIENNKRRDGKPILIPGTINAKGKIKKAAKTIRIPANQSKTFSVVVMRPDRSVEKPRIFIGLKAYQQYAALLQYSVLRDRQQLEQRSCVKWNDADGYCDKCVHDVAPVFGSRGGFWAGLSNAIPFGCSNMRPGANVISTFTGNVTIDNSPATGQLFVNLMLQGRRDSMDTGYRDSAPLPLYAYGYDTVPADGRVPNNLFLLSCQYGSNPNKTCTAQRDTKIVVETFR